jgi:hypothetical protein
VVCEDPVILFIQTATDGNYAQQKEMIVHGLSTIVHQNTMPKNEGIDNDYDYLLNTMVNMGGDIDTPPTEVHFLSAEHSRRAQDGNTNHAQE